MNYEDFHAEVRKYKWRVKWEGVLMLIIYVLIGILILLMDGIEGLVSFIILFFYFPLFGVLAIKTSSQNDISKSKWFKSALKFTAIISGVSSIITSLGTLCVLIDYRSLAVIYTCGIYIQRYKISICLIEFIWLSSIITFVSSYILYRDLLMLFKLIIMMQENRYRPFLHQTVSSLQYIPMQEMA